MHTEKPNIKHFEYMGKRALETYLQAEMLYSRGKNELFGRMVNCEETFDNLTCKFIHGQDFEFESQIISKALSQLTYTLSYLASRERYSSGERAVTFNGILESPVSESERRLVDLRKYYKSRDKEHKIDITEVNCRFEDTKSLLIKGATP